MPNRIQLLQIASNVTSSFRDFVSGTESAFANFGWVNDNASGTINSTVVNPPTITSQIRGYSVWRFNDEFQNIAPVFIKIEYGSGNNTATPAVWITLGKYHDGSGTLSNESTRWQIYANGYTANPLTPVLSAGNTGWGCVCYSPGVNTGGSMIFGVERGRDIYGNINPDIVAAYGINNLSNNSVYTYLGQMATASLPPSELHLVSSIQIPIYLPKDSISEGTPGGAGINAAPFTSLLNHGVRNAGMLTSVMVGKRYMVDITSDFVYLSPYGQTYPYINLGNTFVINTLLSSADVSLFMRWE